MTSKEERQVHALTYGMTSCIDDTVAGPLVHLGECGIGGDVVVIFTSDHGDFMDDHRIMLEHGPHYEGVAREPFIRADPHRPGAVRTDLPRSSVDIGATILPHAGLAPFNGNQELPLLDILDETVPNPRKGILIEEYGSGAHLGTDVGLRTRTYIGDNWRKTIWQGMAGGELFDRNTDRHELRNPWSDPEFSRERASTAEAMVREMIRLGGTTPSATHMAWAAMVPTRHRRVWWIWSSALRKGFRISWNRCGPPVLFNVGDATEQRCAHS